MKTANLIHTTAGIVEYNLTYFTLIIPKKKKNFLVEKQFTELIFLNA